MRVKWRQHEFLMVSILAVFTALHYFSRMFAGAPFTENIALYKNVLIAQYAVLLIQYGCYVWLNNGVIAWLAVLDHKKIFKGRYNALYLMGKYALRAIQFVAIVYLLGPVCNFAEYLGIKDFPDPGMANSISGIFPAHPQEPYNIFGGFDIALFFTGIYMLYALLRESSIYMLEKPDGRRQFRISLTNGITLFLLIEVVAFPLLTIFFPGGQLWRSAAIIWFAVIPATLGVCTVNIYWLFPEKGEKPLLRSPIVGRLLLITAIAAIPVMFFPHAGAGETWASFFGAWMLQLLIVSPLSWLYYRQRKERISQLRGMEEALTRSKADLQFLRSQINPHFLFNALNTLYGTALQEKSERTAEGIQRLGDMMRFMLHDNNLDFIPMQREIEYLQNYIALQKLRIRSSPGIAIDANIDSAGCTRNIAPMMLIPMVENAFKHGISLTETSWIKLELACDKTAVRFRVRNSIHAKQAHDTERNGKGIGLQNVEDRLKLIYPGRHSFRVVQEAGEFIAELHISF
jgi:hypothetical protein